MKGFLLLMWVLEFKVMWDILLHATDICCFYWLMSKAALAMTGQNIARQKSQTECRKKEGGVERDTRSHLKGKMC